METKTFDITDKKAVIRKNDYVRFTCKNCGKSSVIRYSSYLNHPDICFSCNMSASIKKVGGHKTSEETKAKLRKSWESRDRKAIQDKRKLTNIAKYGVDNPAKIESVKKQIESTNMQRYGTSTPLQNSEVKAKIKQTLLKHYGSYSNRPGNKLLHEKFLQQRDNELNSIEWLDKDSFHGKYDNGPIYYHFKCLKCGNEFTDDFHSGMPICRVCNPIAKKISNGEKEVADYIKSIYRGTVIENDRSVLNGKELGIWIPDLKIAIEYNGTYWHGYRADTIATLSEFKHNTEAKRLACHNLGIRLINLDECDWIDRPEVFKRFFQDLLLPRIRVPARKCTVKNIDLNTARDFCEMYHVNGFRGGSTKLGLYLNDELLAVAIFAHHPKFQNECIRLVFKTGYDIIGGWAKLQKHFGKPFLHYVNLKYFDGDNKTGCGYRFYLHKHVYYRNQLQKKSLSKYLSEVNSNLSDFQNCLIDGGIAIFDVGNDIRFYNK